MGDNFLSQEEIDSLLKKNKDVDELNQTDDLDISSEERDIMEKVGEMTMSASASVLSNLIGRNVHIESPEVSATSFGELKTGIENPHVSLKVQFKNGLKGNNALMLGIADASVIANLMMGGDGSEVGEELSEMELSAVSEAMNQMIGKASASISEMISQNFEIDPPVTRVWKNGEDISIFAIPNDEKIVRISFRLIVEDLIDSEMVQLYTLDTANEITANILDGMEAIESEKEKTEKHHSEEKGEPLQEYGDSKEEYGGSEVKIQNPVFAELKKQPRQRAPRNIELILDVPLELSVVLGRTHKSIRDILALEPGSIVELNKLAEEPLEIYVNGKRTALGEVVVVDEKFGIRITDILSAEDRVRKLG